MASGAASDLLFDFEDGTTEGWQRGWGEGFEGENEPFASDDLATAGNRYALRVNTAYNGMGWEEAAIRLYTDEALGNYETVSYDVIIPASFGGTFVLASAMNGQWRDLLSSSHDITVAEKTNINSNDYAVISETAAIPADADQKELIIKLAKNSAVDYIGPIYVDNIRLQARTQVVTPPGDPANVITIPYTEAVLEGYGIEKSGPVKIGEDTLYDGEGYISYFFAEDAGAQEPIGSAAFTVNVEEAGMYKLSLGYYIPEGYGGKATGIQINGAGAGELMLDAPPAGTVRAEKMISKVLLNAGSNTIKISRGWGYYGIEHIKVEPASTPAAGSKLEAEDGNVNGDVTIGTSGTGYSGQGYAAFQQSGSLALTYNAPSAGMYDVVIGYSSPYGEKKTSMVFNGQTTEITFAETTDFTEISAGKAWLNEGGNTIEFLSNWGWYNIDYIKLTVAATAEVHDATSTLINPEATLEARALMNYLAGQYGRKIISGQQTLEDVEWIKQQTGKYPALFSTDLIDYSPSRVENGASSTEVEKMIEWYNRGGIVALCWHWNAPKGIGGNEPGNEWWRGFYTENTTFDVEYALDNPDSEDYRLLIRDIDAIAVQLKRLQDAGVPVLWRPLHEAEGGWFWWGAKGPEPAKKLWNLMYDRLTNHHDLNNLIWVWNSEKTEWYPGDDVVDIASIDIYNPAGDYNPSIAKYEGLVSLVNDKKVVGLAENGPIPDPDLLQAYGADWSFFSTWAGSFIKDGSTNTAEHLNKVYHHDYVITLDELPANLYTSLKYEEEKGEVTGLEAGTGQNPGTRRVEVNGSELKDALEKLTGLPAEKQVYEIAVKGGNAAEVILPATALAQAAVSMPNATLVIKSDMASYSLPVHLVDVDSIAEQLGVEAAEVRISVKLEKIGGSRETELRAWAETNGVQVIGNLIDFSITAVSSTGSLELNDFGSTYVSRTIAIPQALSGNKTAVMLDPGTGEMSFVPALFEEAGGKTVVTIKRNGNSIYAVVKLDRTFADLEGHSAKSEIELMASKLVVHGIGDERFEPNRSVTRAEFAALIARALGLMTQMPPTAYSDVFPTSWYAGAVGAASKAGILIGYANGTFKPDAPVTREQMAVIIVRAAAFAGKGSSAADDALARFNDRSFISTWAEDSVSDALNAGLVQGVTKDRFAPKDEVDRSQAVVLIKRLLEYVNFMNS
ncbi:S-layer homology domain-containing protein [Paenibacillus sp. N4]|uniref:glycosyl hydrolase n=1 Tax=Paenibacillus vietnamensis TaxID=2590547 RepID=UPI001CD17693|nr:glycosyl hydrolase [Paenibacillus vietnamensis]MCA0754974.1 S-layer homology domain-containing protein [Paenibacillus vietnamensis]